MRPKEYSEETEHLLTRCTGWHMLLLWVYGIGFGMNKRTLVALWKRWVRLNYP